ncbi:MAG: sulfatase-like hydrolase/transferase [Anaerotignum sp.]|nr:sulfatase-like hydrolase/transferase [Anaerotignum sp.]
MKKIKFKKPNLKEGFHKLKSLRWADVKAAPKKISAWHDRKLEKLKNSAFGQKMHILGGFMNRFSLIFHGIWAILINYIIEAMSRHSVMAAWEFSRISTKAFLYNAFMIFVTFSIVYLFKRRALGRTILSILWLVLGIVNGIMLSRRVTPFNAQDLKTVAEGISLFTNYFSVKELVALGLGAVFVVFFLIYLWRTVGRLKRKVNYLLAAAVVAASFGGYGVLTDYVIENRIVSTYFANIAFAYQDYGLPYCFAASIFNTGISEPNGYTEKMVADITHNGEIVKSTADTKKRPNVIVVQLESFFDTSEFKRLKTTTDPLPNLRKMAAEYSSGYCQVPSIGAGTANTEFEVITGMNLRYFGPGEYPYKTYLKERTAESAATAFKSFGYGAHAIHNHSGNFYSRAKVFNNTGFETFVCKEFMNFDMTPNGWAKDEVLLEHINDCLDSTEQQDFVFTITVQGHGSYPEKKVIDEPHLYAWGTESAKKNNQWTYYSNQVREMDIFAQNLVDMMDQRGEPAVVVFYGDHLPTLGLTEDDMKSESLFNTNYVIWDNIGLERITGTIPTYQLMATVMDRIGLHAGTIFNYHQERMADEASTDYLMDLELLQYDLLYGKKYAYGDSPMVIDGKIEMGKRDSKILYVSESLDGEYTVVGENFTKWTYVYINGEKQSRQFVNENTLRLNKSHLEDWDVVTVCQVGSSNTIFRTSEEYVYLNGRVVPYTEELKKDKILQKYADDPAKAAEELRKMEREEKRSDVNAA